MAGAALSRRPEDDSLRYRRIRARNATIAAGARRPWLGRSTPIPFLCECDHGDCDAYVVLCLLDYDRYRDEYLFLTKPGHEIASGRRVGGVPGVDLFAA